MNENVVSTPKPFLTVRKVLRVLSALCIVFVFCPVFLVSCSGEEVGISAMKAATGISVEGEQIVQPYPIMFLALLIPVAVLALLIVKKTIENEKMLSTVVAGCAAVDIVIWSVFKSTAEKMAKENYCSIETTGWYTMNLIVLAVLIVFSALVVVNIWKMDTDLLALFTGEGAKKKINQMTTVVGQMSDNVVRTVGNAAENLGGKAKEDVIGLCPQCGAQIPRGAKFCISCGTPIPESISVGEEKPAEAQPKCRRHCGAELGADAAFCKSCGTKVES